MCGRFTLKNPRRVKLAGVYGAELFDIAPRYNIAPTQPVLGITRQHLVTEGSSSATSAAAISEAGSRVEWFKWGLIPARSTDGKGFINARAETLDIRRTFSESFRERRCLIIADGFYEWKRRGKMTQPYYFQLRDEAPFAFAGIWDQWRKDGETINSCAIITTTPNELLAPIHDRMPAILLPESYEAWLSETDTEKLESLLKPLPAAEMKGFPVSAAVNKALVDEPSLVERVEELPLYENGRLF
jgi:putative SOS response-associated peptidase YedK